MLKNGPLCSFPEVEFPCPDGWEKFQGSCYRVTSGGGTFDDSRHICIIDDGGLVAINSEAENEFVKDLLRRVAGDAVTSAWIGVKQNGPVSWTLLNYDLDKTQRMFNFTNVLIFFALWLTLYDFSNAKPILHNIQRKIEFFINFNCRLVFFLNGAQRKIQFSTNFRCCLV